MVIRARRIVDMVANNKAIRAEMRILAVRIKAKYKDTKILAEPPVQYAKKDTRKISNAIWKNEIVVKYRLAVLIRKR